VTPNVQAITGRWALLFRANPLVGQIDAFRWALLGDATFPVRSWSWSCAVSTLLLVVGVVGFRRLERSLADVI